MRRCVSSSNFTADIKAAFCEHGPALVAALIKLTKSKDENVRVKALKGMSADAAHMAAGYTSLIVAMQLG